MAIITNLTKFVNFTARYEAHSNFIAISQSPACDYVSEMKPDVQCNFVKTEPECTEGIAYINYVELYFCTFNAATYMAAVPLCLMLIGLAILIMIIFEIAVSFLYPISMYLCNAWYINEHISGITLLSYAYGSSHVYGATRFKHNTEVSVHSLIGSCFFDISVVAASCIVIKSFKTVKRYFLRDTIFLIITLITVTIEMIDEQYCLFEVIILISLYFFFIIYIFFENCYLKRLIPKTAARLAILENMSKTEEVANEIKKLNQNKIDYADALLSVQEAEEHHVLHVDEETEASFIHQFLDTLSYKNLEWNEETNSFYKIVLCIRYPIRFLLHFILPCVDDRLPLCGWSKLLFMINILILPQVILLIYKILDLMLSAKIAIGSLILIIIVLVATKTNKKPPFIILFCLLSYVGIVCLIFFATAEIIGIVMTFSVAGSVGHDLITLLMYSLGHSVGNMVTNVGITKRGHHRMAFAGVYGSTIYQLIFGITALFIVLNLKERAICVEVRPGEFGITTICFVILTTMSTMVYLNFTNYQARYSLAAVLFVIYFIFVSFNVLSDQEIIHQYDTDHAQDD